MDVTESPAVASPARRRMIRRRRAIVVTVLVALVAGGGYVAASAIAPLPELQASLSVEQVVQVDPDPSAAAAAVAAQTDLTAIGWAHEDDIWVNDSTPHPLASLSKLITVLVCQEAEPLAPGADGPIYTWTEEDVQRQADLLAIDGVAYPIDAGTEISLRDMLKLIFLPSSNDYAVAYAYSVFGDNETFLAAVTDWADRNGLSSLSFVEPSGMDEANMASADDLLRIARMVLNNPTLSEFTGMNTADIPGIGLIENSNPLLGEPGIIGLKTGTSSAAGYNFIAAQTTTVDGRELVKLSVTLGRPSKDARAASGREMLGIIETLPQALEFVTEGAEVGSVTTWAGEVVPLVTSGGAGGVLVPGETATLTVTLDEIGAGPAGAPAGSIAVESPLGAQSVEVVTDRLSAEPDLWWRLTHPATMFGWT